ncbi:hypothetical protein ACH5RR_033639 [Cinchona calisaya]|uniref:Uncharacterized protein n=1 Tax=Cinchona calisaya TaxID=153742 RepID=A0ABD2Y9W2_9GENT
MFDEIKLDSQSICMCLKVTWDKLIEFHMGQKDFTHIFTELLWPPMDWFLLQLVLGGQDASAVMITDHRAGKFEAKFYDKILQAEQ